MPTVTFQNPGLIPLEAVVTLGVNVKENDNPIGLFGTGLKYAIASILRTGQKITIYRGLEVFEFVSREEEVRGKTFGFIYMNEARLGFTTHLGSTWEPWQIFRELYSNCLDEAGGMTIDKNIALCEEFTTIIVEGQAFAEAASKKDEIFLSGAQLIPSKLIYGVEVYSGSSEYVYYRGIRTQKLSKPSAFTYNIISPMVLTEDRTFKEVYNVTYRLEAMLESSENREYIEQAVTAKDHLEFGLDYSSCKKTFAETVLDVVEKHGVLSVSASTFSHAERFLNTIAVWEPDPLNDYEQRQLIKAVNFLTVMGFDVMAEILVVKNLGTNVHGMARNGKIYLAKHCLGLGEEYLIGTILEEHVHLTLGLLDETRSMQNYLFALVVKFAKEARGQ